MGWIAALAIFQSLELCRADDWNGFEREPLTEDGRSAFVTKPKEAAPGRPWVWRTSFPDFHAEVDRELVSRGFHIAYLDVVALLGSDEALDRMDRFYTRMTNAYQLAARPVLEGVSRGGMHAYLYAARHPDRVAALYCDTPVMNLTSWPLDWPGATRETAEALKYFGLADTNALKAFRGNPIDRLEPIARAQIPIRHVVSLNDRVVPPEQNTFEAKRRLIALGHDMELVVVTNGTAASNGHHFALPAIEESADFIERHGRAMPPRPNIVLLMADDMGWTDTGYNSSGNPQRDRIRTPNLDAMAARGIRFNRFYSQSPNCSPTRGSVLTGRHPYRYGVMSHGMPIDVREQTIAGALKTAGYRTGHFGKWHLNGVPGPGRPVSNNDIRHPGHFGFDTWFSASNFFETDAVFGTPEGPVQTKGDGSDAIMERAIAFIEAAQRESNPFLAVVWFGSPHAPIRATAAYRESAGGSDYYGEILGIDHSIGTLRAALESRGLTRNTMLVFCSDNGGVQEISTIGLRGRKGQLWEGGIRVPGLIEWPGRWSKPRTIDAPVVTTDLYPTLLELTGVTDPAAAWPHDGVSLVPLLDGLKPGRGAPIAFWHDNRQDQPSYRTSTIAADAGHAVWMDETYKLHRLPDGSIQLFDLTMDPVESRDLAAVQTERVTQMSTALSSWIGRVLASASGGDYPRPAP